MEAKISEILENILGMLGLEGSFEVVENDEEIKVIIETKDAGRLIGFRGETLDALQLIINQIVAREKPEKFKRVIIDVEGWRKKREEELTHNATQWAKEAIEKKTPIHLEPMPSWQRRIIHLTIAEIKGVSSESIGEGRERHLVINPDSQETKTEDITPPSKEADAA